MNGRFTARRYLAVFCMAAIAVLIGLNSVAERTPAESRHNVVELGSAQHAHSLLESPGDITWGG